MVYEEVIKGLQSYKVIPIPKEEIKKAFYKIVEQEMGVYRDNIDQYHGS